MAFMLNGKIVVCRDRKIPRQHAAKLPTIFTDICTKHDVQLSGLDGLAVSIGPGSFTGLRIGLSFVKGLAYSHDLPIIPVPTLQGIAQGCKCENNFFVLLFSHGNMIYYQEFDHAKYPIGKVQVTNWETLSKRVQNQTIFHINCEQFIAGTPCSASANHIALLAAAHFNQWVNSEPYKLTPNYIIPFTP